MTQDQVLLLIRASMTIVGTFLTTYGVMTAGDWATVSGAVVTLAPIFWGLWIHSRPVTQQTNIAGVLNMPEAEQITALKALPQQKQIALVAAMPEVKGMLTTKDLAAAVPSNKVVATIADLPTAAKVA